MVSVNIGHARNEGQCCACHRYTTPNGVEDHAVAVITLRPDDSNSGIEVRLCMDCLKELKGILELWKSQTKK